MKIIYCPLNPSTLTFGPACVIRFACLQCHYFQYCPRIPRLQANNPQPQGGEWAKVWNKGLQEMFDKCKPNIDPNDLHRAKRIWEGK